MKWFKNKELIKAPTLPHPSHEVIKGLNSSTLEHLIENKMREYTENNKYVAYTRIDTSDKFYNIRTGWYYASYRREERLEQTKPFFRAAMEALGYPIVTKYKIQTTEDYPDISNGNPAIHINITGEPIKYSTPAHISLQFVFLGGGQEDSDFLRVHTDVIEAMEEYFINPNAFKIEQIVQQARREIENDLRHQREEQTGSPEQLPQTARERTISYEDAVTAKELREHIRDCNYLL